MTQTMTPEKFNELVDVCIDQLADDRVDAGVEAVMEIATLCKSAGMGRAEFVGICEYMESEAVKKSDAVFVQLKISNALKAYRERRNGTKIIH